MSLIYNVNAVFIERSTTTFSTVITVVGGGKSMGGENNCFDISKECSLGNLPREHFTQLRCSFCQEDLESWLRYRII